MWNPLGPISSQADVWSQPSPYAGMMYPHPQPAMFGYPYPTQQMTPQFPYWVMYGHPVMMHQMGPPMSYPGFVPPVNIQDRITMHHACRKSLLILQNRRSLLLLPRQRKSLRHLPLSYRQRNVMRHRQSCSVIKESKQFKILFGPPPHPPSPLAAPLLVPLPALAQPCPLPTILPPPLPPIAPPSAPPLPRSLVPRPPAVG